MKKTELKKKLLISSLAFAMVTTSTLFSMPLVYGEGEATAVLETTSESSAVKAILINGGRVMGRNENGTQTSNEITNLDTVTDLLIDANVTEISAGKFNGKRNLTTLAFRGAAVEGTDASQVASIGNNAFKGTGITSVVLPKNLTTIGENAFTNTASLTTVDFTNTKKLTTIGKWAFVGSGLTSLDLSHINDTDSQSVLSIGEGAFRKNGALTNVTLSSKMTELLKGTFSLTNIKTIELPKGIAAVHPTTFQGTPLATLTVNEENTVFEAEDNVLYNKGKTSLHLYPEGKAGDDFTIPNTVTTVKEYAFSSSPSLTKVVVGEALSNIEYYAFEKTVKLTTLDLRNAKALINIGANAFNGSLLSSMIIGNETGLLTTIGTDAFGDTTPKTVSFKNSDNSPIIGADKTALVKKYAKLKDTANGTWKLDSKFATPTAVANYGIFRLTDLEPDAIYTIQSKEYTAEGDGSLNLLKSWSGQTLSIIRIATGDQEASDAQALKIKDIYSVYRDGKEVEWKIEGNNVTVTAPMKNGHQFTGWESPDVTSPTISGNKISFTMPGKDVKLTTQYTAITVETPAANLIFDGKKDVPVTIVSTSSNFDKLKVKDTELTRDKDYTVTGTDKTTITLKKDYLDALTEKTTFEVTFKEGGTITFILDLYGPAPVAEPNYTEMKLTKLEANAQYKINEVVKTADTEGTIAIERSWGGQTLEIIKVGTSTETDSKPQNLDIKTFYTIIVNGTELGYTVEGTQVTVESEGKEGYNFKEWSAPGVVLPDATKEKMTFTMPASNVVLTTIYTSIITTKPEEMVYNGKNEVIIRFDVPMADFKDIEYNGKKLVKNVDYIVTSGSTIITFTKTFLDKINGDINGLKAVFTNNAISFTIKHQIAPPIVDPGTPQVQPAPVKPVVTLFTKSPNTGDTTNMTLLFTFMLVSIGAFVGVKKKQKK